MQGILPFCRNSNLYTDTRHYLPEGEGEINTDCGTRGNEVIKSALDVLKNYNSDYTKTRKVIDLLFDEMIINEVLFTIQDSHVVCTVSSDPKKIEFLKYFQQDSAYHQASSNGKTEQEAFFNALSKIATFII